MMWKCPVCRAPYRNSTNCARCRTDLTNLLEIRNTAITYYNKALQETKTYQWENAIDLVEEAIHHFQAQGEFHLLYGKILAHLGYFDQAVKSWKYALELDPKLISAKTCLQTFADVVNPMDFSDEGEGEQAPSKELRA